MSSALRWHEYVNSVELRGGLSLQLRKRVCWKHCDRTIGRRRFCLISSRFREYAQLTPLPTRHHRPIVPGGFDMRASRTLSPPPTQSSLMLLHDDTLRTLFCTIFDAFDDLRGWLRFCRYSVARIVPKLRVGADAGGARFIFWFSARRNEVFSFIWLILRAARRRFSLLRVPQHCSPYLAREAPYRIEKAALY